MSWYANPGTYTSTGYRAAEVARQSGRTLPRQGSGDSHLRWDRELLARMGDDFDRSNAVYAGIVNRFVDGVLGPRGFSLQADTGSESSNREIERDWSDFCRSPEVRGLFSWQECERLALRSIVNHGDVGVLLLDSQRYQYIEAHRITGGRRAEEATRNGGRVEGGVEMDALDTPRAYWVAPYNQHGYVMSSRSKRIRSESFVHVANRKRFSQTRGVPVLVESYSMIHRLNDVLDAEAIAWQLLTKFAVSVTMRGGADAGYAMSSADEDGRDQPPDLANRYLEVQEGTFFFGEPGEEVKGIERNLPGSSFETSVRMFLRAIGLPLGLPLEVILLDYSQTNYTGARAALEQAWITFKAWQALMKRQHHTPLYEAWLRWQVDKGNYPDLPRTFRHSWTAPEFPWIDQLKEAQAWGTRIDRGLATQTAALKSVNIDRQDWLRAKEAEVREARAVARSINLEDADDVLSPVDWHVFAGHEAPPASSAMSGPVDQPESDPDQEDLSERLERNDQRDRAEVAAAVPMWPSRLNGNGRHP